MTPTNKDHAARALRTLAAWVAVATLVVLGILAVAAVRWTGRIVVALLFLAIVIASAIRPSVEALKRQRVPRGAWVRSGSDLPDPRCPIVTLVRFANPHGCGP
jgi:hypothetical protein